DAKARVQANAANGAAAPGAALVNARVGGCVARERAAVGPVFGVQNRLHRKYAGSVAVNAAGAVVTGKFYEPGPRQTWFVGLSAATVPWWSTASARRESLGAAAEVGVDVGHRHAGRFEPLPSRTIRNGHGSCLSVP